MQIYLIIRSYLKELFSFLNSSLPKLIEKPWIINVMQSSFWGIKFQKLSLRANNYAVVLITLLVMVNITSKFIHRFVLLLSHSLTHCHAFYNSL